MWPLGGADSPCMARSPREPRPPHPGLGAQVSPPRTSAMGGWGPEELGRAGQWRGAVSLQRAPPLLAPCLGLCGQQPWPPAGPLPTRDPSWTCGAWEARPARPFLALLWGPTWGPWPFTAPPPPGRARQAQLRPQFLRVSLLLGTPRWEPLPPSPLSLSPSPGLCSAAPQRTAPALPQVTSSVLSRGRGSLDRPRPQASPLDAEGGTPGLWWGDGGGI